MSQENKVYRNELTPVSFLRRSAYVYPEKVAVVHGDRRYTYKEFEERVNRLASRLQEAGLQKGDRVAFLASQHPADAGGALCRARGWLRAGANKHAAQRREHRLHRGPLRREDALRGRRVPGDRRGFRDLGLGDRLDRGHRRERRPLRRLPAGGLSRRRRPACWRTRRS